ncbi:MAG: DUF4215 domain-containing protein [Sandaracinaceae bacterium]|nr:DUF4215 domain-containing protein [Sandaracinaceae bacterium]
MMRRLGFWAVITLAGVCTACSETHGTGEDAGTIMFDGAVLPDGGPTDLCPNGVVDPGEMCDDGNATPGDGCDAMCRREAYCGDGTVGGGEVCDDGNNASGDGCRSDCLSDETCGNGIVDFAAGEICDGAANCGADCMTVTGCGDGTVEAPEECENDPGNTDNWDGCNAACQNEIALVMSSLALAGRGEGCDFNGDGTPDNAFARALGLLSAAFGPLIEQAITNGDVTLLLAMLGLDDPSGRADDDFRIAWLQGADGDMDATNNFSGSGQFLVDSGSLNADGSASTSIQSQVAASMLTGGPEDIPIPISFFPIELKQGRILGQTVADGGELYEIRDGTLCGGIPASLLALLGGFLGDMLITDPPCDGGANAELLDVIIAGGSATIAIGGMMIPVRFSATAPDLDLDADGLEGFETERGSDCQPVVTSCIDGDGTRIDGRGCFSSPEIADGYSAAFSFDAIRAELVGTTMGGMMPPPPPPGP